MNTRIWIALMLGAFVSGAVGYCQGKAAASGRYERTIAEMTRQQSKERELRQHEDRQRLEAVAQAERDARERLQTESARVAELSGQLSNARRQLSEERQTLNRRLADVSKDASATCRGLPSEWVRLYNAAASPLADNAANSNHRTGNTGARTTGSADGTNATRSTGAGIQPDSPLTSPEDILAHVRDYGEYCRSVEAQRDALSHLVKP